ncbi:MAG: endolytic transglycosylase MltG [Candidatus Saccharimonadales bacterium]
MSPRITTDGIRPVKQSSTPPGALPRPTEQVITDIHQQSRIATPPPSKTHDTPAIAEAAATVQMGDDVPPQSPPPRRWLKRLLLVVLAMSIVLLIAGVSAVVWYQQQLRPVAPGSTERVRLVVEQGTAPSAIGSQLYAANVIRNTLAFSVYTKLSGTENTLKAGTYNLSKGESVQQIVDHLVGGKQDTFRIMFLPGDTLAGHRQKLLDAGYSEAEVDAAFAKEYQRPLFAGKPAEADLEGYIYGQSYDFTLDATVEGILNRTFDEYEQEITKHNLVAAYQEHGLTLFEGITLASIIQKEVSDPDDSKQVAQVFFRRLNIDMPLGADATFVYAAKKAGQQPSVTFDSPYNTRTHKGLPPGPISSPGLNALLAVAQPASGDYLYFVSGDDGRNHFSRTLEEHEASTRAHCIKNCSLF